MKNFENRIITPSSGYLDSTETRKKLFERKKKIVDDFRPHEEDFIDLYKKEDIEKDLQKIANLAEGWENNSSEKETFNKEVAEIFEGVISDQVEANAWLGENCRIVPAARYDDIRSGVDLVAVFTHEDPEAENLNLGIDVTFSANPDVLYGKLDSIKNSITQGYMSKLKYFQNPTTEKHMEVSVPRIVVGSNIASAEQLIYLWNSSVENKNKKLASHPMRFKLFVEALYQVRYFYDFALELSQKADSPTDRERYQKIAKSYADLNNELVDIISVNEHVLEDTMKQAKGDVIFETIQKYTGNAPEVAPEK